MNRKIKYAIAALLGFSTACSTVKTAPKATEDPQQTAPDTLKRRDPPRIVVMYGVRPPQGAQPLVSQPVKEADSLPSGERK